MKDTGEKPLILWHTFDTIYQRGILYIQWIRATLQNDDAMEGLKQDCNISIANALSLSHRDALMRQQVNRNFESYYGPHCSNETKPRLFGISVKQPPEYDDWYFQFGVDVE